MKKNYLITLILSICFSFVSFGQGSEKFTGVTLPTAYSDDSFVGAGGITWTYVHSRDANGDANNSGIDMPALMLRRSSNESKITSSTISGGIGDFSVKLYKGFTGGGNRQVELFINGVSKGTSVGFDDYNEHVFSVSGINITGDIIIEIKNITGKQVIIDDITWTEPSSEPTLSITFPNDNQVFQADTMLGKLGDITNVMSSDFVTFSEINEDQTTRGEEDSAKSVSTKDEVISAEEDVGATKEEMMYELAAIVQPVGQKESGNPKQELIEEQEQIKKEEEREALMNSGTDAGLEARPPNSSSPTPPPKLLFCVPKPQDFSISARNVASSFSAAPRAFGDVVMRERGGFWD